MFRPNSPISGGPYVFGNAHMDELNGRKNQRVFPGYLPTRDLAIGFGFPDSGADCPGAAFAATSSPATSPYRSVTSGGSLGR